MAIPIPMTDVSDKIIWKFSRDDKFSVKTTTWTNNDQILSYPNTKILNSILRLKLISKVRVFAYKLMSGNSY